VGGGDGSPHAVTRRAVLPPEILGGRSAPSSSPRRRCAITTASSRARVVLLHDVHRTARACHRQMSYPGDPRRVDRPDQPARIRNAVSEEATRRRGAAKPRTCCVTLDLDRFKIVNDSSGQPGRRLDVARSGQAAAQKVRDSDTVARLGGDEFGMLLVGCPARQGRQIADDVCGAVAGYQFVWQGPGVQHRRVHRAHRDRPRSRVGGTAAGRGRLGLLRAKKEGASRVSVYSARDEALARSSGEIEWLQKLQGAIKEERFTLYYQPIVAAFGTDAEGPSMEVLLRMLDETGKEIQPSEFVHAAERFRLMASVDRWVVQTTLHALSRNAFQLARDRSVAINISGQTLGDPQFLEFVVECFDRTGIAPIQVCFEIAENAVINNLEHARRFVGVLHGMGCKFTIDDFGSGVGSFSASRRWSWTTSSSMARSCATWRPTRSARPW
jgi:predicted signal transduction protein with EAL and GGDEF domain